MEYSIYVAGMWAGFLIAFPKGPCGMLVIYHSVSRGFWSGIIAACGLIATTFLTSTAILFLPIGRGTMIGVAIAALAVGFVFRKKDVPRKVVPLGSSDLARYLFAATILAPTVIPITLGIFKGTCPQLFSLDISGRIVFFLGLATTTAGWYLASGGACALAVWIWKRWREQIISGFLSGAHELAATINLIRSFASY